MNSNFYEIKQNQSVKNFIIEFEQAIKKKKIFTAIKFNKTKKVLGVITRGDLRRLILKNTSLNKRIDKFLNLKQIKIKINELNNDLFSNLEQKSKGKIFDDILLVDEKDKFLKILRYNEIKNNFNYKSTCVIGMGHIGLPLSIFILKKFKNVIGYDINQKKLMILKIII